MFKMMLNAADRVVDKLKLSLSEKDRQIHDLQEEVKHLKQVIVDARMTESRLVATMEEDRKELINKIKRADLIFVYLCIIHLDGMAGGKVSMSYRDGLIDAFRTMYGHNETDRLWEYLNKRRERMTRLINYMLRVKMGGEHK